MCALDVCSADWILSEEYGFSSPSGDDVSQSGGVTSHFGNLSNGLGPKMGTSYGYLSTGIWSGAPQSGTDLLGGSPIPDEFDASGMNTFDNVEFTVDLVAPDSAAGFALDYVFLSSEYEEYIGSDFNDKFYIQLQSPTTTGGEEIVINTTECSDPNSYYDQLDADGNPVCFIAINTAFSEPCNAVVTDLSGTGFECPTGSSTGWLTTVWPIEPGEEFTLTFHIHDTGDGAFDSAVLLDNFRFLSDDGGAIGGGTTITDPDCDPDCPYGEYDACGVCNGDNSDQGCDGVCFSGVTVDDCGVCGGSNECFGCDGVANSGLVVDQCGVCGGADECLGCDGVPNSGVVFDDCGVCGGANECICVGELPNTCAEDCLSIPDPVDRFLCGVDICQEPLIGAASFNNPGGDDITGATDVVSHFGNLSNDLAPFAGESYSLMSTGSTSTTPGLNQSTTLPGGNELEDPFASDSLMSYDHVEFKVELTAPPQAVGFAIDYVFMSVEYEEYIGSNFNDKFYIQLNAPSTTSDQEQVINFTDCSDPDTYYDLISPLGEPQCYIAINTAFSESCADVITDISGTGFECPPPGVTSTAAHGSSTGWLTTGWPIQAGETFTLTFHIHDTGDQAYDSLVILDNFRFVSEDGAIGGGGTTGTGENCIPLP